MSRASVVSVHEELPGVAVLRMEDRDSKNSFSPALVADLREAFRVVGAHPGYRDEPSTDGEGTDLLEIAEHEAHSMPPTSSGPCAARSRISAERQVCHSPLAIEPVNSASTGATTFANSTSAKPKSRTISIT